ncbi:NAD(P)-binding protein [Calocera cornea HHB12733]|uniref:NAD(P)-binding protein n=1 Tax=Calocera cornea HHB12733 TaxID=1353952 RepID=A0A165J7T3_9BASI|nr:NAD(P)-binding protein [Calocera cornea HHB12733]
MSGKTALLIGATGNTGSLLLRELLASPHFTKIGEFGRRVTPSDTLPTAGREKLEQHTIDFDKLDQAGLEEGKWDVVFVTLGTTRKLAGSVENWTKIDKEYVVNAAKHAHDPSRQQRLVYLSSAGANPQSSFLYTRSKGETELALAALGYGETIVFRPAVLQGATRAVPRYAETAAVYAASAVSWFWDGATIHIKDLAKSIRIAGDVGVAGLPNEAGVTTSNGFTVIDNRGALALSKTNL